MTAKKILCLLLLFQCLFPFVSIAQERISGTVVSESGENLPGASITVKGSTVTSVSHDDGSFTIMAKKGDHLVVSFVGYTSAEVLVVSVTDIRLTLKPKAVNLNEIMLTGYTYQKVKEIAGSVASVKPKDLKAIPTGEVEQMLQGRVAGLNVITSGEPGSPTKVRLHGIGNFGDVTPLYIIDGVQGDINALNPDDIESLQVLKDAGSYSIYGVRGANGVVVVTTKRGMSGKPVIVYDGYVGLQLPVDPKPAMLNPQERADLLWRALRNSHRLGPNGNPSDALYGNGPAPVLPDYLFAGNHMDTLYEGNPLVNPDLYNLNPSNGDVYQIVRFDKIGTDWFHTVFKPAWSQKHSVSASGGNDKNHYLLSLGYLDQQGTMINTYLKRYTVRVNTELLIKNLVHVGENLQLTNSDNPKYFGNDPSSSHSNIGGEVGRAITMEPSSPVYDIMGAYNGGYLQGGPQTNSLGLRELGKTNKAFQSQIFGNVYLQFDFLRDFNFKSNLGGSLLNYNRYNFFYGTYANPELNFFEESAGYARSYTWTNSLNYDHLFGGMHMLKVFVATETIDNYNREMGGSRKDYFSNDPNYHFLSTGNPVGQNNYSFAGTSYLSSIITKVDYAYKEKYLVSATIRRDGSSIFGKENRFGWFPAFGIAWRMTEEEFAKGLTWLSDLKLRGSWGKTGFYGNTDPFNQFTLYGGGPGDAYYDIFGISSGQIQRGFRTIRIGNPKTGWQEDEVLNLGLESVFWNGKLSVTADWYTKNTKGLLFAAKLPDLLGDVTQPNVNVGNIKNNGVDLTIGSKGSFSRNWSWDALLTFSHYKNRIVKLNALSFFDDLYGIVRNEVGYPISSYFGYKIIGLFQGDEDVAKSPVQRDAAPGRFKYLDANKDGKITDDDRVHLGDPNPDFTVGVNLGIEYRNFDFTTFFYGSFGNDVFNGLRSQTDIFVNGGGSKVSYYDSWSPAHSNARAPIPELDYNFSNAAVVNSYPIEKGSYLRNRSVIIGYTFPKDWLRKSGISRLRIYLQAVNLFTITNYTGIDPELYGNGNSPSTYSYLSKSTFGIDFGNYPNNQRQFLFGVNLRF